jgi:hypothetical protein
MQGQHILWYNLKVGVTDHGPLPPPGATPMLELIEHIPRVPWCITSATDSARSSMRSGFDRRV